MWTLTNSPSTFPYTGGFFLIGLATACVILSAIGAPRSLVPRFLSLAPDPLRRPDLLRALHLALAPLPLGGPRPHRAERVPALRPARARHLRRLGGVVPPGRAPDPHGDLPAPGAGLAGGADGGRRSSWPRWWRPRPGRRGGQHHLRRFHRRPDDDHDHGAGVAGHGPAGERAPLRRLDCAHARLGPRPPRCRTRMATCSRTRGFSAVGWWTGRRSSCWARSTPRRRPATARRSRRASPTPTALAEPVARGHGLGATQRGRRSWPDAGRWSTASTRASGPTS